MASAAVGDGGGDRRKPWLGLEGVRNRMLIAEEGEGVNQKS
jgi:hypothetical protein